MKAKDWEMLALLVVLKVHRATSIGLAPSCPNVVIVSSTLFFYACHTAKLKSRSQNKC